MFGLNKTEKRLYKTRMAYISEMTELSSSWDIYQHILPHYKYITTEWKGFRLYIWDDNRDQYPVDLPIFPRLSPKRNPATLNKVIIRVIHFAQDGIKEDDERETPFLLGRRIMGTNIFLPKSIKGNTFTIESGRTIGPLAGGGSRELWKKYAGVWGIADIQSTWIS